jgi:hypothetical protein
MQLNGEMYVTFPKSTQRAAYAVNANIRGRKEMKEADFGALSTITARFRKRARA